MKELEALLQAEATEKALREITPLFQALMNALEKKNLLWAQTAEAGQVRSHLLSAQEVAVTRRRETLLTKMLERIAKRAGEEEKPS